MTRKIQKKKETQRAKTEKDIFPWGDTTPLKRALHIFTSSAGLFIISLCISFAFGCTSKIAVLPETSETISNWTVARAYQAEGRYELSRQYYLLALAASRTAESHQTLQRELDSVDRMIEAMR